MRERERKREGRREGKERRKKEKNLVSIQAYDIKWHYEFTLKRSLGGIQENNNPR